MDSGKKIHFLVCVNSKQLIEQLKKKCEEVGVIPDFIYKKAIVYNTLPLAFWFEEEESAVDSFRDHKHYEQTVAYSQALTNKVLASPFPVVCCVSVERNIIQLMHLIISRAFTSLVILFHPNTEKLARQKSIFGGAQDLSGGKLSIVDSVEEIFKKLAENNYT